MELEDFMSAKRKAEKEIKDAVENAIETFRQRTDHLPNSISVRLIGCIKERWALRVRVEEVNINI